MRQLACTATGTPPADAADAPNTSAPTQEEPVGAAASLLLIVTPHSLRRTFASILAGCDVRPRRAMYLMGHNDASRTLAVYQRVLDMGNGSVAILEQILGCTLAEARAIYNGECTAGQLTKPARRQRRGSG